MIDHKALERLNFAAISSLKMMEKGKETPVELLASKMVEYMQAAHPLLILELLDFYSERMASQIDTGDYEELLSGNDKLKDALAVVFNHASTLETGFQVVAIDTSTCLELVVEVKPISAELSGAKVH